MKFGIFKKHLFNFPQGTMKFWIHNDKKSNVEMSFEVVMAASLSMAPVCLFYGFSVFNGFYAEYDAYCDHCECVCVSKDYTITFTYSPFFKPEK